jgi:chromosome segregation ATPase
MIVVQHALDPADTAEESLKDEVSRKIAELEIESRGPVPEEVRERIASKIQFLRAGQWLKGLKPGLAGADSVPIEILNRLADEYENTIAHVAEINAKGQRRLTEKDAIIIALEDGIKEATEMAATHESLDRLQTEEIEELRAQVSRLEDKLRQDTPVPHQSINNDEDADALAECQKQAGNLQHRLNDANAALKDARSTSSRFYNEIQSLRQQRSEGIARERGLKDEVQRLEALLSRLEEDNKDLVEAVTPRGDVADSDAFRKRIAELESQLNSERARCNDRIKTLESEKAYKASRVEQDRGSPQTSTEELQAHCAELRTERDSYRDRWAQALVAGNPNLLEYWQAVEHTNREINQLHRGIERLCRAVGNHDNVVDVPQALEKVIDQVTGMVSEEKQSLQLTVLNLRFAIMTARLQNETLQHQLDSAQLAKTDDEIKADLRIVDEEEVERRVNLRTETYRDYRLSLLGHIFDAQAEFLALAATSANREAIEVLIDRFLQPTSLPAIQLAQGGQC